MSNVLVVDDEQSIRVTLGAFLRDAGYAVETSGAAREAQALLSQQTFDVIVSDIILPGISGIELLKVIRGVAPRSQVIMMTGEPSIDTAAEALRSGAFDYLTKPVAKNAILRSVSNAIRLKTSDDARRRLERENADHRRMLELLVQELRQEVDQRKQVERVKDDFVGMVSHELRTPLAITKEAVALLLDQIPGKLVAAQHRLLMTAQRNMIRLATLIDDLLDVSALDAGKLTIEKDAFDFGELTREVCTAIQPLAAEKGLAFRIPEIPGAVPVTADRNRMFQVLMNLGSNAIKYTVNGSVEFQLTHDGDNVWVQVEDTGIGIPKDALPTLFGRFQRCANARRTGEHGTGLGLFITQQLVTLHGGTITVQSEEGVGSTFVLCIPCAAESTAPERNRLVGEDRGLPEDSANER